MVKNHKFGPFDLFPDQRLLLREGSPVPLNAKEFDTLTLLLEHAGKLVHKDTLRARVWLDTHVSDSSLQRVISDLRKALDPTDSQKWIETVPKFGYRMRLPAALPIVASSLTLLAPNSIADSSAIVNPGLTPKTSPSRTGIAFAAALALAVMLLTQPGGTPLPLPSPHPFSPLGYLSVPPFAVSPDLPDAQAIGAGLAEEIAYLLRSEGRTVLPPSPQPGIKADTVLVGELRLREGSWLATLRLLRPSKNGGPDKEVWRSIFRATTIPALLDRMSAAVLVSPPPPKNWRSRRAPSPEAHALYLRARYQWNQRTRASLENSLFLFHQAIDLHPSYALAHAGVADCYLLLGGYGIHPQREMLPLARVVSLRATLLDPQSPEPYATLGLITQNLDWDWKLAESYYQEAIKVSDAYPTAHHWYAEFLSILGRFPESHAAFSRARNLDPLTSMIPADEALAYIYERRYGQAREILTRLLAEDPNFEEAAERLAWVEVLEGNEHAASQRVQSINSCRLPQSPCRLRWAAWLNSVNPGAAKSALNRLEADPRTPPYALVVANARHGNLERALDHLETMMQERAIWLITAKVNPFFDPLRSHPRMTRLLATLHLSGKPNLAKQAN